MARSCLFTWGSPIAIIFKQKPYSQSNNACWSNLAYSHKFRLLSQAAAEPKANIEQIHSESESSDAESGNQFLNPLDLKINILNAALHFVPEHGWSKTSLAYGAQSLGLATSAHSLIEGGGAQLVHYFNFSSNQNLDKILKENVVQKENFDLQTFFKYALETRLKMVIPYSSNWNEALAIMMFPTQFLEDTKNVLELVDIIWHHTADKSLDVTWYTKRLSLGIAYKACELSLIQDKSPEFVDTFEFLDRRIEMIIGASKLFDEITQTNKQISEVGRGAFITIRNILGANRWFR